MTTALTGRVSSETKRTVAVLAVCSVAMWPPLIAGRILLGPWATVTLLFASMVGFVNTAVAGRRIGAAASLVFVLAVPASVVAGTDPLAGASQIALASVLVGAAVYWERLSKLGPTLLVGLVLLVAAPTPVAQKMTAGPTQSQYLLAVVVAAAVCAFWPVVLLPKLMPIEAVPAERRTSFDEAAYYAAALAVLVSATSYWALEFARDTHGVWLPLTIVLVLQVTPGLTIHRLLQRVYGTVLGAVAAALIVTFAHPQWSVHLLLAVALLGMYATNGREPYGLYAFFLTALILVGASASEPAASAIEQRVLYTVIGAGLAFLAVVVRGPVLRRTGRGPGTD
jgi:hypothetical protein